jgi:antitoxin component of RelBE/YafQ-DinJ toxin-antitoxin module
MNSTIMVRKDIKERAAKKAKQEGVSLSTVVRFLLKGYAEGRVGVGLVLNEEVQVEKVAKISLDKETQSFLDNSTKKWRHKINS